MYNFYSISVVYKICFNVLNKKRLHLYFVASREKPRVSDLFESHVAADDLVNLVLQRQTNELRQLTALNTEDGGVGPHHINQLDELQAHGNHHWVLEVGNWTDHLVVASEEGFDQARFIGRGPGCT